MTGEKDSAAAAFQLLHREKKFFLRLGAGESSGREESSYRLEEKKMLLIEILGFWFVVGLAFFGWRRAASGKGLRVPQVLPPSNGRRA